MTVSSKHSFKKRETSLLLFNPWQREWLKVFSKVSTETSRKATSTVPWSGCCFQRKNIPLCWELRQPRATPHQGAARRQCRNRGLGMELVPLNQAVPVEHVWVERTGYRSEQKPCTFFAAKEWVDYCSQLHFFFSFLQGRPELFSGSTRGAGAKIGGRGMAELSKPGNKETFPFPACWNNPLGWCELYSLWINCERTVCLWMGERDSTNNNLQSLRKAQFGNYGLSF